MFIYLINIVYICLFYFFPWEGISSRASLLFHVVLLLRVRFITGLLHKLIFGEIWN